ncbi:MAG: hypothetical protein IH939_18380, partial [Acidobacteria bacterium]|nr:hypothetical protein [Acidobacteriota bacterium]
EQEPIHQALQAGSLTSRMGQALEIAVFKALKTQSSLKFFGRCRDLDAHDDSQLYSKEEPPNYIGIRETPTDQRLDFLVRHPEAGWAGIEVKNIREWLYPNRVEIIDFLYKCTVLDAVPVLIARRFPWVTFHVLGICGVVVHQNYNQLLPVADSPLAEQAKHKRLLGYHDIRLGNEPDARLIHFIHDNLPEVLPSALEKFDEYKDLLAAFSAREMDYDEFAGRVRRRNQGLPEDADYNIGEYDY